MSLSRSDVVAQITKIYKCAREIACATAILADITFDSAQIVPCNIALGQLRETLRTFEGLVKKSRESSDISRMIAVDDDPVRQNVSESDASEDEPEFKPRSLPSKIKYCTRDTRAVRMIRLTLALKDYTLRQIQWSLAACITNAQRRGDVETADKVREDMRDLASLHVPGVRDWQ